MSIDLSTNYGGLFLHSPIVVGACPMTTDDSTRLSLEAAGAGAIVLPSVFEEQVIDWTRRQRRPITARETALLARSERIAVNAACVDAESYLALVNRASNQLGIPVIASLNGYSASGWLDYAGELQEAGAAGVELNVHRPPVDDHGGAGEIEDAIVAAVGEVDRAISVPLFVKVQRGGVSVPHLARRLMSGASGMVLFGRSPEIDICLDSMKLNSTWNLTPPGTATQLIEPIIRTHHHCPTMSIVASGGVSSCEDVIKVLLAGADAAMVTSQLYREGADSIRKLIDGLTRFLEHRRIQSLTDLRLERPLQFASDEERSHYIASLSARRPAGDRSPVATSEVADRWGHTPRSPVGQSVR